MCYYLIDGIYPKCAIFIDTISNTIARRYKIDSDSHNFARKDAEQALGVLLTRWDIISEHCNYQDKSVYKKVMKVCISMHKMIAVHGREGYESKLFQDGLNFI